MTTDNRKNEPLADHASAVAEIYPCCRRILGPALWKAAAGACLSAGRSDAFVDCLANMADQSDFPAFLPQLAQLERRWHQAGLCPIPAPVDRLALNPTLTLTLVDWQGLEVCFQDGKGHNLAPVALDEALYLMIWVDPQSGRRRMAAAASIDLLALKIISENIELNQAAVAGNTTVGALDCALKQARAKGLALAPPSAIRRDFKQPTALPALDPAFLSASVFTLQWHLTNRCDLNCRHCYDRTDHQPLSPQRANALLQNFYDFCKQRHVDGQVTFTGGNPLMYPHFFDLYRQAANMGFGIAILGNPANEDKIDKLLDIVKPAYIQVSLEGMAAHNDYIRGRGHFSRTLDYLTLLRDRGVYTMVMLTLTAANIDQVLPLGRHLAGRTDSFTFNRLSQVGQGAALDMPTPERFNQFLADYLSEAGRLPHLRLKDNLINILQWQSGRPLFGGCTGYGCGAAFNFVAILPNGDVHACRKFPSFIGNAFEQSLGTVYDSLPAQRYRHGSQACRACALRPVCRGCMASVFSQGGDVFADRDPYCCMTLDRSADNS